MPMLVGDQGMRAAGSVWLGWDPAHPSQAQLEPLVRSISVPSASNLGSLPTVGWRGTSADDVGRAVTAGARLIHAGGSAEVEAAVGTAAASLGAAAEPLHVITSLDLATGAGQEVAEAACAAAAGRLGGQGIDILLLNDESWGVAEGLVASGLVRSVGLQVGTVAEAVPALQRVLLNGGAQPAVLCVPLNPLTPLVQRMLLGLCRRKGVRVLALDPLGGTEMAAGVQAACMAATSAAAVAALPEPPEVEPPAAEGPRAWQSSAVSVLLGWSVAREVIGEHPSAIAVSVFF